MPIIKAKNLSKRYQQGNKTINAVDGVNLEVEKGDLLAVIGPSGSGKSTLLMLIGGLDRPTSGEIEINGVNIAKISDAKLTNIRRNTMGYVFQNFNLIPTLTAAQNVEAVIAKRTSHDRKRVMAVLQQLSLDQRAHHLPSLLSGGEQQRVAIARALINEPDIILADEPTGNLDSKTGEDIIRILADLKTKHGKTVVIITHSEYVKKFATKVVEIRDGKITPTR
ncbi:MAG: ABC transporter ATP-binding protein [Patescibacteria group bacterium]|nr:ABC transporter ATP-binding protein [Patescibacteria group bacterium]MDD5715318.1 ABC transporter ATP-binding protein [Patescibacteria group bacterium]